MARPVNGRSALPRLCKVVKLPAEMTRFSQPQSEGALLDSVLSELAKEHAAMEISGWETGFINLSRALDGIRPGLYLLVGAPAIGKTSFARQLIDQVTRHNHVPGMFFSLAETIQELRIRTLARLSGLDQREIRRGSAYLLHWYGVPRLPSGEANDLPPSWEKLKRVAEEAKTWLDSVYLFECEQTTTINEIEMQIAELRAQTQAEQTMVVIDDCQRLGRVDQPQETRLQIVAEQLQQTARSFNAPVFAVWPDLESGSGTVAQSWSEKSAAPDVFLVMKKDSTRSITMNDPSQAIVLHVVKNRGGEKGQLAYDFMPAFARFTEAQ
jgi:replicative DNA helicase